MKEKPILFNGEMVRAILDGRKTQTRRVVKQIPALGEPEEWCDCLDAVDYAAGDYRRFCPFGSSGDRLWVRETFSLNHSIHIRNNFGHPNGRYAGVLYRASWKGARDYYDRPFEGDRRWRPSIHMARAYSRITLEITDVRVERVQDISEEDAIAEGVISRTVRSGRCPAPMTVFGTGGEHDFASSAVEAFENLWDSINAKRGFRWDANPWVWVITFKRGEAE